MPFEPLMDVQTTNDDGERVSPHSPWSPGHPSVCDRSPDRTGNPDCPPPTNNNCPQTAPALPQDWIE
eukprot:5183104-Prorocentrum_lima.AAC.1